MKKIILLLTAAFLIQSVIAQQPLFVNNPYPKKISVSGSAEMEIVPDEIYVNVKLSEYQKKGESKTDIETHKKQFLEACKAVGIPDSVITIASYSGYNSGNYYLLRKKKSTDMFANITYQVKFKDSKPMDDLVDKLDDNATVSFQIVSTSHSKMSEFRKQLKIRAVQAAKEKGGYLTEAIGEKLGETIDIEEPSESRTSYTVSNMSSQAIYRAGSNAVYDSDSPSSVEFKKIKLRYEVNVVFALK